MGLYLYCVTRPDTSPGPTLAGIQGGPVHMLEVEGLSVWFEEVDRRPDPSLRAVRAHHGVVQAATEGGPALPLRFGQWVGEADEVRTAIARGRARYDEALDRVEGAVEIGVRILDPEPGRDRESPSGVEPAHRNAGDPPGGGAGRAYLEALRRRERRRVERRRRGEAVARELAGELGSLVRDERIDGPSAEGELVRIAHLVGHEDVERHAERVRALRERHPGLTIVTSGPWPPYSFTPQDGDGADAVETPVDDEAE